MRSHKLNENHTNYEFTNGKICSTIKFYNLRQTTAATAAYVRMAQCNCVILFLLLRIYEQARARSQHSFCENKHLVEQ